MSDALEVEITEVEQGSLITYTVRILHQEHSGMCFGDGTGQTNAFDASNGFRLRSIDIPEVRQKNYPNERRGNNRNMLFVRGRGGSSSKVMKVTSMSYIVALRVAIKEYNDQFK